MEILCTLVLYNADEFFKSIVQNIEVIKRSKEVKLLLIDNGNSKEFKRKLKPLVDNRDIFYEEQSKNVGPGGGFNRALEIGIEKNYQYVYLIDQDSTIDDTTITELEKEIIGLKGKFSFLASTVMSEKGDILYYFRNNFTNNMSVYSVPERAYRKLSIYKINAAGYTGLLINLAIVQNKRIFINEEMVIDYDDYDFTYRLSLENPGYLVPESIILHPKKLEGSNLRIRQLIRNYTLLAKIKKGNFRRNQMRINYIKMIEDYGKNTMLKRMKIKLAGSKLLSRTVSKLKGN
ncbi:glycosyltransferase [Latilactobacillus sakei]|uniref:glycosyltransferase n=1 Tax=Latilactobacillus sakei TaxID=1599 RepID=UPI00232B2E13|nr:glycosyltransferase [Latilactobacillus sakei]MDB1553433.1 glycosyltransferase [Latilactobacillus sakei]